MEFYITEYVKYIFLFINNGECKDTQSVLLH